LSSHLTAAQITSANSFAGTRVAKQAAAMLAACAPARATAD
jgi:hypothetical protein